MDTNHLDFVGDVKATAIYSIQDATRTRLEELVTSQVQRSGDVDPAQLNIQTAMATWLYANDHDGHSVPITEYSISDRPAPRAMVCN